MTQISGRHKRPFILVHRKSALFALGICLLAGCADPPLGTVPVPIRAPKLDTLKVPADSLLLNATLPVAFPGQDFHWRFQVRENAPMVQFRTATYQNSPVRLTGNELRWQLPRLDSMQLGHYAGISLELGLSDGKIMELPIPLAIMGSELIRINPKPTDSRVRLPDAAGLNRMGLNMVLPSDRLSGRETFTIHLAYPHRLFPDRDFLFVSGLLVRMQDAEGVPVDVFSQPAVCTLSYLHITQADRLRKSDLRIFRSGSDAPDAFQPVQALHDTLSRTFIFPMQRTGLYALAIPDWRHSDPPTYAGDQRSAYSELQGGVGGLPGLAGKLRVFVHDSLARTWLLKDRSQSVPDSAGLIDRLAKLYVESLPRIEAWLPGADTLGPLPIYVTLEEEPVNSGSGAIRLSAFAFSPDDTAGLSAAFRRQIFLAAANRHLDRGGASIHGNAAECLLSGAAQVVGRGTNRLPPNAHHHHLLGFGSAGHPDYARGYAVLVDFLSSPDRLRPLVPGAFPALHRAILSQGFVAAFGSVLGAADTLMLQYGRHLAANSATLAALDISLSRSQGMIRTIYTSSEPERSVILSDSIRIAMDTSGILSYQMTQSQLMPGAIWLVRLSVADTDAPVHLALAGADSISGLSAGFFGQDVNIPSRQLELPAGGHGLLVLANTTGAPVRFTDSRLKLSLR